jgi:hypothetical protein
LILQIGFATFWNHRISHYATQRLAIREYEDPAASDFMGWALALQLHFDVSPSCSRLMGSSPDRPRDDVCWLDFSLAEFDGDAADFLH